LVFGQQICTHGRGNFRSEFFEKAIAPVFTPNETHEAKMLELHVVQLRAGEVNDAAPREFNSIKYLCQKVL
jgi:hypothetical protein